MKGNKRLLKFLPFILFTLFFGCDNGSVKHYYYDFQFITETYKPFNYTESGELKGLAPDLLKAICRNLEIPFKVSVLSWEEGYQLGLTKPGVVLFSTSMNSQRRDLFKWAGPVASLEWKFYALAQSRISPGSLDEAKQVRAIGVLKDYTIEQYLVNQGFTNLIYCKDHLDAVNKLMNGVIDLYPSDRYTTEAALKSLGQSEYSLKAVFPVKTELIYFAFNKAIPDQVVADIQEEIDRLKNSGFLKQLSEEYLNTSDHPGVIQFYTEEYPPVTFLDQYGEISGYGSDVVKEIMKRNRIFEKIRISSWSNGYALALDNPNFCLFTMDKTAIRESLFQWVGPIGTNTTWFYVRKNGGISIKSLEEARKLTSVGTVSSWFSDQYLRNLGFTNLVSDKDPGVMATRLMQGKTDAFVCTDITFPDILEAAGYRYADVTPVFSLMSSDFYISFSKNTPPATVSLWQTTFDQMKKEGTIASIRKRWFPE